MSSAQQAQLVPGECDPTAQLSESSPCWEDAGKLRHVIDGGATSCSGHGVTELQCVPAGRPVARSSWPGEGALVAVSCAAPASGSSEPLELEPQP